MEKETYCQKKDSEMAGTFYFYTYNGIPVYNTECKSSRHNI